MKILFAVSLGEIEKVTSETIRSIKVLRLWFLLTLMERIVATEEKLSSCIPF